MDAINAGLYISERGIFRISVFSELATPVKSIGMMSILRLHMVESLDIGSDSGSMLN